MTSPQPVPNSQPQASPAGYGVQDFKPVLGVGEQDSAQFNAERLRNEQLQSVKVQVQDLSSRLDGIARQFPVSAKSVMALKQGMTKMLVEIVGSSMQGSSPPTGAMG